jgi:hypothetical protein
MDGAKTQGLAVARRRLTGGLVLVLLAGASGPLPSLHPAPPAVGAGPPPRASAPGTGFQAPEGCRNLTLLEYPAAGFPRVLPLTRLCPFEPRTDCFGEAVPGRSRLLLREKASSPKRNRVKWKLKKGQAMTLADLGDPTVDTDYELCVYVEVAGVCWLVLHPDALAGPGWKARRNGFTYKWKPGVHPEGLRKVRLRTGPDRKSRVIVKGKGELLELRTLPMPQGAHILTQLYSSAGQCWSTEFGVAPQIDSEKRYKDRSD